MAKTCREVLLRCMHSETSWEMREKASDKNGQGRIPLAILFALSEGISPRCPKASPASRCPLRT